MGIISVVLYLKAEDKMARKREQKCMEELVVLFLADTCGRLLRHEAVIMPPVSR